MKIFRLNALERRTWHFNRIICHSPCEDHHRVIVAAVQRHLLIGPDHCEDL